MVSKNIKLKGFTIVELLIVIVVIGILAAITIVSYSGISARATLSQNQANANTILKVAEAARTDNTGTCTVGSYPAGNATGATQISNLNCGTIAKVPTGITITGTTGGTLPASGSPSNLLYVVATTNIGVCVYYWDPVAINVKSLTSGNAVAASTPATNTAATCT